MNHEDLYDEKARKAVDTLERYLERPVAETFRVEPIVDKVAKIVWLSLPSDRVHLIASGLYGVSLQVFRTGVERWGAPKPAGLEFDVEAMTWKAESGGSATDAIDTAVAEAIAWIRSGHGKSSSQ